MQYTFKDIYPFYNSVIALGTDNRIYGSGYSNGILNNDYFDISITKGYVKADKWVDDSKDVKLFNGNADSCLFIKNSEPSVLYGLGDNYRGQIGMSNDYAYYEPVSVPFPERVENIIKIKFCNGATAILTNTNNLYMTGSNKYGLFGMGSVNDIHYGFILVATDVIEIYNDEDSENIFIKKSDGTYWGTGLNASSPAKEGCPLGFGNTNLYNSFTQLPIDNVLKLIPGHQELFYIKNDNTLWGCGRNNLYQLGLGHTNYQSDFVQLQTDVVDCWARDNFVYIKKTDGSYWGAGWTGTINYLNLENPGSFVGTWTKCNFDHLSIRQIYFKPNFLIIETTEDTHLVAGLNGGNRLCANDDSIYIKNLTEVDMPKLKEVIDANILYTLYFISEDGDFYQSGRVDYVGSNFVILKNKYRTFTNIFEGKDPNRVIPSMYNDIVFYLDKNNDLYGLGNNDYAQFGKGYGNFSNFTKIASNVKRFWGTAEWTIFEDFNNDLYITGSDYGGIAGVGGTDGNFVEDTFIKMGISNIDEFFAPSYNAYTGFIIKDGTLWVAGYNDYGQLGLGYTSNMVSTWVDTGITNVKKVFCDGSWFTYILKEDGTLWNAGESYKGCLGTSSTAKRTSFTKVMENVKDCFVTDFYNAYVLKEDNSVFVTGVNENKTLGFNHSNSITSFTKLTDNVKSMYCRNGQAFFIKNDNTLWACGENDFGQLGLDILTYNGLPLTQIPVPFDVSKIKKITMSENGRTTYILLDDYTCYFTGSNLYGETGCNLLQAGKEGKVFTKFTPYLTFEDCTIKGSEVIVNGEIVKIQSASSGTDHEAIIVGHEAFIDDSFVYVRGKNEYGQLGTGDNEERPDYTKIPFNNCKEIACGHNHTVLLNKDGEMFVTGNNEQGQLGMNNFENKNTFTKNPTLDNINHIEAVRDMTIVETKDNEIYCSGNGKNKF